MDEIKPWEFTCRNCGGHALTVTHVWSLLAGPESESWREWGPLEADHLWRYDFKEKLEPGEEKQDEYRDFGGFAEVDSDSELEEYASFESEDDPPGDGFFVNCEGCDREIEFGWSQPDLGGQIYPVECSDFVPGKSWPENRYWEAWQERYWLPTGAARS